MEITKKRLFFDIETSPNIGFFWSAGYKINIPYDNIIQERAIICICYKWEGNNEVYSLTWDHNQDDKKLLETFINIANSADELVAHNGDQFDLPWIRTRCLYHNVSCFPSYTTIDTLQHARRRFRFNSNRLDYIAKFLKIGEKADTGGFDLWKDIVLSKSKEALDTMVEYCKNDVLLLEKVYNHLSNYVPHKFHYGAAKTGEKTCCPECGSDNLKHSKTRYTAAGTPRIQVQCKSCHKYHTMSSRTFDATMIKKFQS
jgi:hypothetical protein